MDDTSKSLITAALIGAAIGLGQLASSAQPITWRLALGRAVVSGGLATACGTALIWWPTLHPVALIGLAAALASLGTSGVERLLARMGR